MAGTFQVLKNEASELENACDVCVTYSHDMYQDRDLVKDLMSAANDQKKVLSS